MKLLKLGILKNQLRCIMMNLKEGKRISRIQESQKKNIEE